MKKFTIVLLALVMVVSIKCCGNSAQEAGLTGDEGITMENIDQYLPEDARFVDAAFRALFLQGGG